jgi:predicted Zn-dependent protease
MGMEAVRWWIIGIGVIQGALLWFAQEMLQNHSVNGTGVSVWVVAYALALTVPVAIQLMIRDGRDWRLWAFVAGLTLVIVALSVQCSSTIYSKDRSSLILFQFLATIGLASFIALCFAQVLLEQGRLAVPYESLFRHFWDNILTLALALPALGVVLLLELLWERLFDAIGLEIVSRLFSKPYVSYPINGLIFGYLIYLARVYSRATEMLRIIFLTVFRALLPVLALMILIFSVALLYTGLEPLWQSTMVVTWMLLLQLAAILFVNAAYQDGNATPPSNRLWRRLVMLAIVLLPLFTALSSYWLSRHIIAEGWNVGRYWAVLVTAVLGMYVIGYVVAALASSDRWMKWVGPINTAMAEVVFLVAVLVNTPLLDPKVIAAESQTARLLHSRIAPEQFDYAYLSSLGKPGYNALLRLAYLENHPRADAIRKGAITAFDDIGCSERLPAAGARTVPVLSGHGRIYFVPLGGLPLPLTRLADHFHKKLGLQIEILPRLEPEASEWDDRRRQYVAEELIALMKRSYPDLVSDPEVMLIGITSSDMYIRSMTWNYAFSKREEDRYAVVSTARFDPVFHQQPENDELLYQRLRKMVMKNIGIMYYRLGSTSDRRSVLCGPIMGLADLDSVSEEF